MPASILLSKICTKCNLDKLSTDFCKSKSAKDGLSYWRRSCSKEHRDAWAKANPEKAKAASDRWVANNKDRKNATRVAWNNANPERVAAKRAVYREANSEKIKSTHAAWRAVNPDSARINRSNRRAMLLATGGELSKGLAVSLFKLQKGKCPCCNQPLGENFHLDHKMPLALGGENSDSNMQLLRKICNLQKGKTDPVTFMQRKGFLL